MDDQVAVARAVGSSGPASNILSELGHGRGPILRFPACDCIFNSDC